MASDRIAAAYQLARQQYADHGVDTDAALARLAGVPISLHCWQGDDVLGFENVGESLGGGIAATGNYPGRARTPAELRADAAKALSLIPGRHRFNLHAFYGDFGGRRVDRDEITPEHFAAWIDWARSLGIGLDFNPTCFSHPNAADNFTLSHRDQAIRSFWIRHAAACRRISSPGATRGYRSSQSHAVCRDAAQREVWCRSANMTRKRRQLPKLLILRVRLVQRAWQ